MDNATPIIRLRTTDRATLSSPGRNVGADREYCTSSVAGACVCIYQERRQLMKPGNGHSITCMEKRVVASFSFPLQIDILAI